jgi:hypothetical protein
MSPFLHTNLVNQAVFSNSIRSLQFYWKKDGDTTLKSHWYTTKVLSNEPWTATTSENSVAQKQRTFSFPI